MAEPVIDPDLPGFDLALGGDANLVTSALALEPGWTVDSVALEKIRHRPGERGIVQYRVLGRQGSVVSHWLVTATAHADDRAGGIVAKAIRSGVRPPAGLAAVAGGAGGLAFTVFPYDRRLPGLLALGRGAQVEGETLDSLVPVRHRAGLGATLRGRHGFVKCHPQGGAEESEARSEAVAAVIPSNLRAALPRRAQGPEGITFTEAMSGESLDRRVDIGLAELAGSALAELHSVAGEGLQECDEVPLSRAVRGAGWIERVLPEAAPPLSRLADRARLPSGGRTLVHGDMKPDHVMIDGSRVGFLDLDSAGRGRPFSDVASLVVRLEDPALGAAVMAGYEAVKPGTCWEGLGGELALASVKYALFHAQHRRPGWEQAVLGVLEAGLVSR